MGGDGPEPEEATGALDPERDLSPVGDQDGLEHHRLTLAGTWAAGGHVPSGGGQHGGDRARPFRLHLDEDLHRLDDCDGRTGRDARSDRSEGRRSGRRRQVQQTASGAQSTAASSRPFSGVASAVWSAVGERSTPADHPATSSRRAELSISLRPDAAIASIRVLISRESIAAPAPRPVSDSPGNLAAPFQCGQDGLSLR